MLFLDRVCSRATAWKVLEIRVLDTGFSPRICKEIKNKKT
jgi:hypothetical protein